MAEVVGRCRLGWFRAMRALGDGLCDTRMWRHDLGAYGKHGATRTKLVQVMRGAPSPWTVYRRRLSLVLGLGAGLGRLAHVALPGPRLQHSGAHIAARSLGAPALGRGFVGAGVANEWRRSEDNRQGPPTPLGTPMLARHSAHGSIHIERMNHEQLG